MAIRFLSFALAWAEVLGCNDIFIGVNALDYSGYPDCRPEFIEAFSRMANLATKAGVELELLIGAHENSEWRDGNLVIAANHSPIHLLQAAFYAVKLEVQRRKLAISYCSAVELP